MNTVIRTLLISLLALSTGLHDAHAAGRKKPAHKKAPAAAAAATPEGEAKSESKAVATARAPRVRSFTLDRNRQVVETTPAIARTDAVPAGRKRKEPAANSTPTDRPVVEEKVSEEKPAKKIRYFALDGEDKVIETVSDEKAQDIINKVGYSIYKGWFNFNRYEKLIAKLTFKQRMILPNNGIFGLFATIVPLLYAAVEKNNIEAINALLSGLTPSQQFTLISMKAYSSYSSFLHALGHNNVEALIALLHGLTHHQRSTLSAVGKKKSYSAGEKDVFKILSHALHTTENLEKIKRILDILPLKNRLEELSTRNRIGSTLLHTVIINNTQTIKFILDGLASWQRLILLSQQINNGFTPLHLAVSHKNRPVTIEILTDENTSDFITILNNFGDTARDINPEFFDECAKEANKIIDKRNNEQHPKITMEITNATNITQTLTQNIIAAYLDQPSISVPAEIDAKEIASIKDANNPGEETKEPVREAFNKNTCFFCHKKMLRGEPQIAFTKCRNRFHKNCLLDYCEKNDVDVNHPFNCPQCGTEVTLPKERDPLAFAKKISADHTTARAMDEAPDEVTALGESKRAATPAGTDDASTNYAKCFICNNRLLGQDNNIQACGHIFHDDCIHDWHNLLIQDNHALNCPECDALAKNTHETPAPTRLQSPAAPAPTVTNLSSLPAPRAASPIAHVATPAPAGEDTVRTVNVFDGEDTTSTWGQKDMSLGE